MTLQRLDAIATGILATGTGVVVLVLTWVIAGETFSAFWRQEKVTGTVVRQETSKVCRRTERGNALNCLRWEKVACPIVQYQPETGPFHKVKTCSQVLSVGTKVDIVYDRQAPSNSQLASEAAWQWLPLLTTVVPLGVGGMLTMLGIFSLRKGLSNA